MATRQQQVEEKFGFGSGGDIHSLFTRDITTIAWDIASGNYDVFNHPKLQNENGIDWLFFLMVRNKHASIWAVASSELKNVHDIVCNGAVWPCDLESFTKESCLVRRYHVIYFYQSDCYFIKADDLSVTSPEYDVCLYVGTLTISERALDALMASVAERTYLILMSDCLEYCKGFVYKYCEMTRETLDKEQKKTLESLTITTIFLSQLSERSGRQSKLSGSGLRSFLTSPLGQVLAATLVSNVIMVILVKRYMD